MEGPGKKWNVDNMCHVAAERTIVSGKGEADDGLTINKARRRCRFHAARAGGGRAGGPTRHDADATRRAARRQEGVRGEGRLH